MNAHRLSFLLSACLAAAPTLAHADTFQLGIGAFQTATLPLRSGLDANAVVPGETELRLRARFFDAVGVELAIGSSDLIAGRPVRSAALTARASALLFLVSGERGSLYLAGGVGTGHVASLLDGSAGLDLVHAGAGFELYLTQYLALAAEVAAEASVRDGDLTSATDVLDNIDAAHLRGSLGVRVVL